MISVGKWWFYAPNDERESWCFLTLKIDRSVQELGGKILGWQVGYGNPKKMTRIVGEEATGCESEREVLEKILEEIRFCSYRGIKLITFNQEILSGIRTKILLLELNRSFHGVSHVCISDLLRNYFSGLDMSKTTKGNAYEVLASIQPNEGLDDSLYLNSPNELNLIEKTKTGSISNILKREVIALWRLFLKIGPLVSRDSIKGDFI